jgi:hypothetical protein
VNELTRYLFQRLRKNERGAEAIEFAVALPVLLLLVFGIIEFGWIFHGYITLTGAAREGARVAVVMESDDDGEIENAVKNHARIFHEENLEITIEPAGYDEERKIIVTGDLDLLISFPPFPNSVSMKASATMRQEQ